MIGKTLWIKLVYQPINIIDSKRFTYNSMIMSKVENKQLIIALGNLFWHKKTHSIMIVNWAFFMASYTPSFNITSSHIWNIMLHLL